MSTDLPSLRSAAVLTGAYLVVGTGYIVVSTLMVTSGATSVEQAARTELFKGLGFVLITGLALGFFALRRFAAHEREAQRRLSSERALLEAERRSQAGVLAAATAHDANNLLAVVCANLFALKEEVSAEQGEEREVVEETLTSAMQISRLMRRLRDVGKPPTLSVILLGDHLREACALVRRHPDAVGVELDSELCEVELKTDPVLLLQLLMNLMLNAMVFARHAQTPRVFVRSQAHPDGTVTVEVHDTGPGLPAGARHEAWRTGRKDGTGLGLVSVFACADALGGTIDAGRSERLGGACITVRLSSASAPAHAA